MLENDYSDILISNLALCISYLNCMFKNAYDMLIYCTEVII